jgi:hypothetical protein
VLPACVRYCAKRQAKGKRGGSREEKRQGYKELDFVRIVCKEAERRKKQMKANPLMRVLAAKAAMFVGLALIVAVVVGIMSVAFVDTSSMAQTQPPNPPAQPNIGAEAVINQNASGGYPIEGTYTSKGGTLILYVSGSGWSANAGSKIGTTVLVEGAKKGQAWSYTNEATSHKAFVPAVLVVQNQPAGQLAIELNGDGFPATTVDQNDSFRVTVLEIPK